MRSRFVDGDPRLLAWLRVREFAVPPPMIESATARRAAGDWAGACAAARVDADLDLRALARAHGRELAARVRADLRHLAPDLLRWHMPRVAPDGLLRPGLTVPLARYGRGVGRRRAADQPRALGRLPGRLRRAPASAPRPAFPARPAPAPVVRAARRPAAPGRGNSADRWRRHGPARGFRQGVGGAPRPGRDRRPDRRADPVAGRAAALPDRDRPVSPVPPGRWPEPGVRVGGAAELGTGRDDRLIRPRRRPAVGRRRGGRGR